ncbi:MAG: Hsp33 family molecular chaperone HslO [Candidatus Pelagadaptatus aseana]|uniref:Hsp33 family molecular chaperone HslO n=1 Tax=Candidatus Pelagadaptatus aseana TaxID=3120508 RepID=UPI0039B15D2C
MCSKDLMHRFLFDKSDIRGEIVTLANSYQQIADNNPDLPGNVQTVLGEFVAAVSLLSSTLKFDGVITLQARGNGPVSIVMAECNHHNTLRGIARLNPDTGRDDFRERDLRQLLGSNATLTITIDPDKGERYQGVVPLDSEKLSECLEHYFSQSEQLPTRFWLASDSEKASGLMLQALPRQLTSEEDNTQLWQTAVHLAETVKPEELLELEHATILYRLFNEEEVRLFEPAALHFACSCSRERSANALISLGKLEVERLLQEQEIIKIDCQFCNQSYTFGQRDLGSLFGGSNQTLH